jgi:hypothetical protein
VLEDIIGVLIAIVGLAALATAVSKKADTAKVLDSLLGGYDKAVANAVSPVTGK